MASLALLRKKAKEAGIAAAVIRRASTAEELQSIIDDSDDDGGSRRPAKKKGRIIKKKATRATKPTRAAKPKKNSGVKSKPAATSRKSGKAKRTTAGTTNGYVPKGGRNLLDSIDFNYTEGWNAREGSAPSVIISALKKARGNREKAFEALKGNLWDFVGKIKQNGDKRTKPEAEEMLRYRISRTLWDFAMRTGQHEKAKNRVEYGTGGTGEGVFKPRKAKAASSRKAKTKTKTKASSKKNARKEGNKKRSTSRR
jgi:hypothetical protein